MPRKKRILASSSSSWIDLDLFHLKIFFLFIIKICYCYKVGIKKILFLDNQWYVTHHMFVIIIIIEHLEWNLFFFSNLNYQKTISWFFFSTKIHKEKRIRSRYSSSSWLVRKEKKKKHEWHAYIHLYLLSRKYLVFFSFHLVSQSQS